MDYTGPSNMENTDESKIVMQEIRDNVTTYMKDPVPDPKEETFTAHFVRTYISSLLGLHVVVTSTFAAVWALIAKVFVLKSAIPLGTQLLMSEVQVYLKRAEVNLEEVGDGITNTVQKVMTASENGAKMSRKELEDDKKQLQSKLVIVEECMDATEEALRRLQDSCNNWVLFLVLIGSVVTVVMVYICQRLLENNGFGRMVAAVLPFFNYAFVLLMVVSFYRLIVFLYNYAVSIHVERERLKSRLREVKQQCREKKRSVKEMLDQISGGLDPEEDNGIEEL